MKKFLSMILAVLLLCGGVLAGSLAEGEEMYEYTAKGKTAIITGVKDGNLKEAVIPAEIDGKKVVGIAYDAFHNCTHLKSVVIPEGVQKIENWAFPNCTSLESINIPDSLTTLERVPFSACFKLGKVEISPYHKVFGVNNDILFRKKDMTLIKYLGQVEDGVEIVQNEYEVFWGIKNIEEDAFIASKLTAIKLPETVQNIGMCAFTGCYLLKTMEIPEGVKSLGTQLFMHDFALESVTIPASVTKIGDGIFSYCSSLKEINVSPKNRNFEANGLLLIDKKAQKIISASAAIEGQFVVPDGIKAIGGVAFQGCEKMTEIIIPDSVKKIDWSAFWNCEHVLVKGHAGSAAQKFCEQAELNFEVIE